MQYNRAQKLDQEKTICDLQKDKTLVRDNSGGNKSENKCDYVFTIILTKNFDNI